MYSLNFTQDCFIHALERLSQVKEYNSISISDLCKVSGFSRSSFYRHFQSKEQLLLHALTQMFQDCADELQRRGYGKTSTEYDSFVFAFLRKNKRLLSIVHLAHLDFALYSFLQSLFQHSSGNANEYQSDLLFAAPAMLIIRWIDHNMNESDAYMVRLLSRCRQNTSCYEKGKHPNRNAGIHPRSETALLRTAGEH